MNAYIIDGTADASIPVTGVLEKTLASKKWETEKLVVRDASVYPCMVCNGCSERTIGECMVRDDGFDIARHFTLCDLFIMVTEVTFGGYSSLAKRAFERTLPNILPYFTIYKRELHHKLRYPKRPALLFLGYLPEHDEEQEELFSLLAERNARNYMTSQGSHVFVGNPVEQDIAAVLNKEITRLTGGKGK